MFEIHTFTSLTFRPPTPAVEFTPQNSIISPQTFSTLDVRVAVIVRGCTLSPGGELEMYTSTNQIHSSVTKYFKFYTPANPFSLFLVVFNTHTLSCMSIKHTHTHPEIPTPF